MALPIAPLAGAALKLTAGAMAGKAVDTAISSMINAVKNGNDISSLADMSRPFRVEPLVLVEQTLQNQPYMEDIMKMVLSQFSAYYLQAFHAILGVGSIDTLKVFDSLNPHRSVTGTREALLKGPYLGNENYAKGLPSLEHFNQTIERGLIGTISIEEDGKNKTGLSSAKIDKIHEVESLSVGKLLNVELKSKGETAKLPVFIRLLSTPVKTDVLTHIFTGGGRDSWGERLQLARAGMIRPIRDLIFGIDLLDEHRKALMNDSSGAYKAITDRRRNNVKKAAMSGVMSAADASNIAVVTKETAREMGKKLYGKIENTTVRERMFNNSYLLLLVVVDERWEKVTVYHRGLDIPQELSFKEIKSAEKGKGQDIGEIFKMFHTAFGGGNI